MDRLGNLPKLGMRPTIDVFRCSGCDNVVADQK
jgi:hypothetical protein